MLAQQWEGSARGMGLTMLVGGLDLGVWEVLTGLGARPDGEQGPGQAPQRQRRPADGAAIPVLPGSLLCPSRVCPVWCFTVTG